MQLNFIRFLWNLDRMWTLRSTLKQNSFNKQLLIPFDNIFVYFFMVEFVSRSVREFREQVMTNGERDH